MCRYIIASFGILTFSIRQARNVTTALRWLQLLLVSHSRFLYYFDVFIFFHLSDCLSVVGLWSSSSLSTGCVVPLRGTEPFSATLAQDGFVECDQAGKNLLK